MLKTQSGEGRKPGESEEGGRQAHHAELRGLLKESELMPRAEQSQEGFDPGSAVTSFMVFKDHAHTQHPLSLLGPEPVGTHQVRDAQRTGYSPDPEPQGPRSSFAVPSNSKRK